MEVDSNNDWTADPISIELSNKPTTKVAVRWTKCGSVGWLSEAPPALSSDDILVVFLNGLMTTMDSWTDVVKNLSSAAGGQVDRSVVCLTYDRLGQGRTTDRDPLDHLSKDPSHGHGIDESVRDLRSLTSSLTEFSSIPGPRLILVANSIGCAISRLYASEYPGTVAGQIYLDSIIRDADLVQYFPDPDGSDFDRKQLPADVNEDDLRQTRSFMHAVFGLHNGSREGLTRRGIKELLPDGDSPKTIGWSTSPSATQEGSFLTVMGHDPRAFAIQSFATRPEMSPAPQLAYLQPVWENWNRQLCQTSAPAGRVKGPITVGGAGHFIQKDRPDAVTREIIEMIEKVGRL